MGLRARTLNETGNWLNLTDCSNASSTVNKNGDMLAVVTILAPALAPFVAKCYGEKPANTLDSGENWTTACPRGVRQGHHQGGPMGQAVFCSLLRRGLERFRVEFVREGVEALAYMNDITRGLMAVTANTVSALLVLQFELDGIGIVVNFTKTCLLYTSDAADE